MIPITLIGLRKTSTLLRSADALTKILEAANSEFNLKVPLIRSQNIVLSAASAELGDRNVQLTYPRVCLFSTGTKNSREEKYRAFSGTVSVIAEILASGNLVNETDEWVHYYAEAVTGLLRENAGDWGDGIFFGGVYEVSFQAPKVGGLGFVQAARVSFNLIASRD